MSREKRIAAGDFKARCLTLLEGVDRDGTEIVVTKRGRPVARIVPITTRPPLHGSVRQLVSDEELVAPLDVAWDAER